MLENKQNSQIGNPTIKVKSIEPLSLVDGEGLRFVLFTPGCTKNCPGCHNKDAQDFNNYKSVTRDRLKILIQENSKLIDGFTISGGDPLDDLPNTYNLLDSLPRNSDVWLYTGDLFENIPQDIKDRVTTIVDGRYMKDLPPAKYRGSSNQRVFKKIKGEWKEHEYE